MPPSTSTRKILIHYHIFKNAGTSIERSLEKAFGRGLHRFETERPDGHLRPADARRLIEANDDLQAITSHQLHPPVPEGEFEIFPLVILREPISRVRSAYLFEWQKQPGLSRPKGSFRHYVEERLADPRPGVIADFQVAHLSRRGLEEAGTPWTDLDAGLEVATEFLNSIPAFGLVERFDDSVHLLNHELAVFYEGTGSILEPRRDNVTQDPAMSLDQAYELTRNELGDELFEELLRRNSYDLSLYRWAVGVFDERWRRLPAPVPTIGADGDETAEKVEVPSIELVRLSRRVQWQDEVLAKVDEEREHDRSELETARAKLDETRRELMTLKAMEALEPYRPPPPQLSRRARALARIQSKLGSVQRRLEPPPDGRPPMLDEQRLVAESGLFDPDFYRENNPDVVEAGVNVLEHYVVHGGLEGRAASELFDSARYLAENADVRQAGTNPLVHYVLHGRDEGRPAYTLDGDSAESDDNPYQLPTPDEFEEVCAGLRFRSYDGGDVIDVSVVIPVYNEVAHTIATLEALAGLATRYRYEVIVMDDCSDDPAMKYVQTIPGLRLVRNDVNLGFLRNCNRGAELARGRHIVFLNNDTRVDSGWLDPLVSTLDEDPTVGLVGSKLVYPDGRLQEAGGVIFADGSGWNYGRLNDPDHPDYNYVRDVDYVSGASIMIERSYFERLGGFDESFVPAYYEDTDLCFRIRADGRRVVYQPASVVVHFEGVSSGTDLGSGVKRHQAVNRAVFEAKWRSVLQAEHGHERADVNRAADKSVRGHVLILDATVPTPDQDSGSVDMFNLVKVLTELGYRVHFLPTAGMCHGGRYTVDLQQIGVKCIYGPYYTTVADYLGEVGDIFDVAILSRVNVATACLNDVLRHCPSARTVFYTVDLHFLRAQRKAEIGADRRARRQAAELRETELSIMDKVDTTVVLSEQERALLAELGRDRVEILPLIREPSPPPRHRYEDRDGVVFVGGFRHPPNVDAVEWLLGEIWPLVGQRCRAADLGPLTLRIIGSNIPRTLAADDDSIEIYGFVENIQPIFERTLLSIAPLRYGAGLKGKIATSFDHGVPVIGTSIAFEGMPEPGLSEVRLCADSAAAMADLIVDMATDAQRWHRVSKAARVYNELNYSIDALRPRIATMVRADEPAHRG